MEGGVIRFDRGCYVCRFHLFTNFLKPMFESLTGIELPCEATLGRRFRIDHFGGIIISGDAVFGDNTVWSATER